MANTLPIPPTIEQANVGIQDVVTINTKKYLIDTSYTLTETVNKVPVNYSNGAQAYEVVYDITYTIPLTIIGPADPLETTEEQYQRLGVTAKNSIAKFRGVYYFIDDMSENGQVNGPTTWSMSLRRTSYSPTEADLENYPRVTSDWVDTSSVYNP